MTVYEIASEKTLAMTSGEVPYNVKLIPCNDKHVVLV